MPPLLPFILIIQASTYADLCEQLATAAGDPPPVAGDSEPSEPGAPELCTEGPSVWQIGAALDESGVEVARPITLLHHVVNAAVASGLRIKGEPMPAAVAEGPPDLVALELILYKASVAYSGLEASLWNGDQVAAFGAALASQLA